MICGPTHSRKLRRLSPVWRTPTWSGEDVPEEMTIDDHVLVYSQQQPGGRRQDEKRRE